jgi:hypothetical protein
MLSSIVLQYSKELLIFFWLLQKSVLKIPELDFFNKTETRSVFEMDNEQKNSDLP